MARPPSADSMRGHMAMTAYAKATTEYLRHLGFPGMSAFWKSRSRGTVRVPTAPEDPELEWTGKFIHGLGEGSIRQQVILRAYDPLLHSDYERIRNLCNKRRFDRIKTGILRDLTNYLRGCEDAGVLTG